ncbi:hypothetical protein RFI_37763 [Reticulomyxa filosa]|uniref:Uncharacterized protein n=1 Tax=Reticulomyxa filosa TaxID=46433 RepID=X6LCE7_RETFI|nr:hypothetical protein RFI_37763 [Reticulomyxa filosa]|eukprot:ETN99707.1 hypothetical protein RFI_37763 [Reticulomyxa filosa]
MYYCITFTKITRSNSLQILFHEVIISNDKNLTIFINLWQYFSYTISNSFYFHSICFSSILDCFEINFIIIMLVQLQQTFPKIDEEIISDVWKAFKQDVEKTKSVLTWLTENTTNLRQQQHLMQLFKEVSNQLEKTTISQTWRNCNRIFVDTLVKLREICATSNLNELNTYKISLL